MTYRIFQVSFSESTKTGIPPSYKIGFTEALKVNVEHITSSPGWRSFIIASIAAKPEAKASP